jgi:hypothetical protein
MAGVRAIYIHNGSGKTTWGNSAHEDTKEVHPVNSTRLILEEYNLATKVCSAGPRRRVNTEPLLTVECHTSY